MIENLFKRVNCVIPIRYFKKSATSKMSYLTPHILMIDSSLTYDMGILAIVKYESTHVNQLRLEDGKFV